jgi:hypothetical protein
MLVVYIIYYVEISFQNNLLELINTIFIFSTK